MDNKAKVLAIIIGIAGYILLKYTIEPWMIEVVCRELVSCEAYNG